MSRLGRGYYARVGAPRLPSKFVSCNQSLPRQGLLREPLALISKLRSANLHQFPFPEKNFTYLNAQFPSFIGLLYDI